MYGMEMIGWVILLTFYTPVITSLVLVMLLPAGARLWHKALFHIAAIPALYGLSALWFRMSYNALEGYFFFTIFITVFFLYLKVRAVIFWARERRK